MSGKASLRFTPVLVREEMMIDAGFFPTDRNQVYELPKDDLFLTGTSEVALAGLHRGDLLEEDSYLLVMLAIVVFST